MALRGTASLVRSCASNASNEALISTAFLPQLLARGASTQIVDPARPSSELVPLGRFRSGVHCATLRTAARVQQYANSAAGSAPAVVRCPCIRQGQMEHMALERTINAAQIKEVCLHVSCGG